MTPNPASDREAKPLSPLLELLDQAWGFATENIHKTNSELMPQFLAQTPDGGMHIYVTPWGGEEDKNAVVAMLKQRFAETGIVRYVMMSEAWVVRYDGPDAKDKYQDDNEFPPSKHPRRISALAILGVDPQAGEVLQYTAEIKDLDDGTRRVQNRDEFAMRVDATQGRMVDLLGPVVQRCVN